MVMMGLYTLGDVPFTDVFIHAKILDGKGETMSKSKGNGIDPADIISRYGADAMRFVLCDMQTGTQDIRLPVQAICPAYDAKTHSKETVELAEATHGRTIFTYLCPECGEEFDVLGTMEDLPAAPVISDRFEVGRNFCTKLWNAARFTLLNLGEQHHWKPITSGQLADEDRWILSRLARAIELVSGELAAYNPSAAIGHARDFFWSDLCDWYLEITKARLHDGDGASDDVAPRVLALALDQVLRLLHPFVPFITERLWERLNERAPIRGLEQPLPASDLLVTARWPEPHPEWRQPALEGDMDLLQAVVRAVRDVRNAYTVSPRTLLDVRIQAPETTARRLQRLKAHLSHLAGVETLTIGAELTRPPAAATRVVGDAELFVLGAVDPGAERARLGKQRDELGKQIAATEARLGNEQFVAKAPAHVVEGARTKLAELNAELERVEQSLAALDGA
jgi:valyl-tRNA synthetase